MFSFSRLMSQTGAEPKWVRLISLALVLGFGAFIVGCSTMDDMRAEEEASPALFGVEILEAPEEVTAGETVQVQYRITNTGQQSATQDIRFRMDGKDLATRPDFSLDPDQSRTRTFSYQTSEEDVGPRRFGVASQDDSANTRVRVEPAPITISADVLFEFDSAELRDDSIEELDEVATMLNENPDTLIRIEGHTDSVGTESYNQQLSEQRAQSVADYLADQDVPRHRMLIEGRGERDPVASNDTEEGRQQNRRVEIHTI